MCFKGKHKIPSLFYVAARKRFVKIMFQQNWVELPKFYINQNCF